MQGRRVCRHMVSTAVTDARHLEGHRIMPFCCMHPRGWVVATPFADSALLTEESSLLCWFLRVHAGTNWRVCCCLAAGCWTGSTAPSPASASCACRCVPLSSGLTSTAPNGSWLFGVSGGPNHPARPHMCSLADTDPVPDMQTRPIRPLGCPEAPALMQVCLTCAVFALSGMQSAGMPRGPEAAALQGMLVKVGREVLAVVQDMTCYQLTPMSPRGECVPQTLWVGGWFDTPTSQGYHVLMQQIKGFAVGSKYCATF